MADREPPPAGDVKAEQAEVFLQKETVALEAIPEPGGHWRCGTCLHLPPGSTVTICGEGFTKQTVRVRLGAKEYFVLRTSIAP
jgi:hypothetical protein